MPIDVGNDLPPVGPEPGRGVIREPGLDVAIDGDAIVVIQADELAKAQRAGQGAGLVGNALHQAAVAEKDPGVVIHHRKVRPVELGRQQLLRERHANGIGQPLAQGTRRGLDAEMQVALGMTRRMSAQLPETPDLVHGERVAGEMEQGIEEHRAMAVGQDKAVPVRPGRIAGVMAEKIVPEHLGHVRHAHRHAWVAGPGLFHGVQGKHPHGVGQLATLTRGPVAPGIRCHGLPQGSRVAGCLRQSRPDRLWPRRFAGYPIRHHDRARPDGLAEGYSRARIVA